MVVFSLLEKKGNLGNQLFQIASTIGIAKKNKTPFAFPNWKYADYFDNELPKILNEKFEIIDEKYFHFHEWKINSNQNVDLNGWMQSEKYFDKSITEHYFKFKDSFVTNLKLRHKALFEKKTILISIRRGDFVGHKDYFQLPILYYVLALNSEFPDWRDANLLITSDDIGYCKFYFSFLENALFAEDLNAVEQLCLGSLCDDFIISNSTFSWWLAYLGEKSHSKIVRPLHYFDNQKAIECSDKDYFPNRWKVFNHLNKKIDFKEVTFILENVNQKLINSENKAINIELINQNFDTNLIFDADATNVLKLADFHYFTTNNIKLNKDLTNVYRNKSIENVTTDFIVILDTDTLVNPFFIAESLDFLVKSKIKILKHKLSSIVVARKPYFKKVKNLMDIGIMCNSKSKKEISNYFTIFDKTKIDFKNETSNFKDLHCTKVSFSFSHRPMLYFGIQEKFHWLKFQLFAFHKFYLKPFIEKKRQ